MAANILTRNVGHVSLSAKLRVYFNSHGKRQQQTKRAYQCMTQGDCFRPWITGKQGFLSAEMKTNWHINALKLIRPNLLNQLGHVLTLL